jgi:hypothetical protein
VINTKDSDEEKRKKSSEELKLAGNKAFQYGAYQLAEEYFTSAILHWDRNHVLYNNRALARISQNKVKYYLQIFSKKRVLSGRSPELRLQRILHISKLLCLA